MVVELELAVVDVETECSRTFSSLSVVGGKARGVSGGEEGETRTGPPLLWGGERSAEVSGRGLWGCRFGEVWSNSS